MNHLSWLFISVIVMFTLAAGVGMSDDAAPRKTPAGPSAEERTATFRWFSTLGFPDVKGRKLVQIRAVSPPSQQPGPQETGYGFLVNEDGGQFTVITPELSTQSFRKNVPGAVAAEAVTHEPADLAAVARECLKDLRTPPESELAEVMSRFEFGLAKRTRGFILAWACWRNGLEQLAAELYDHAAQMPVTSGKDSGKKPTRSLRALVAAEIAHEEMWHAILNFEDPSIPRTRLLERFERIVNKFPESEHYKRALETAALLRQMIKEDVEHASRIASRPFERMSKQEQIAELIFQLRDQKGGQFEQPGSCDIFLGQDGNTPAHRLVKMGYDAVPRLIEALENKRFTRSVGFHRNFYFSHYVLRVGDCSEMILERIAAQPFWEAKSTFSYMTMDGKAAETKKRAQAWYAELQQKGEKQMLIEATQRGDQASAAQAERLLERYPDAALPAILNGINAANDGWTRGSLVAVVGRVRGDGPHAFLLSEVKQGPFLHSRLAAAEALQERGRPEGAQAMIAEWLDPPPTAQYRSGMGVPEILRQHVGEEREISGMVTLLASCGRVDAIKALAKDLRKRPVEVRSRVIESFHDLLRPETRSGDGSKSRKETKANVDAVRAAITDLLVAALDDTDKETGRSGTIDDKSYSDPRICDLAAHILRQREPSRYSFDLSASLGARNRSIIEIKNMWRKARGLDPLVLPARRTVVPVPKGQVSPLIEEFLRSDGPQQQKTQAEIEKLGLGALPAVSERLAKMNAGSPSRLSLTRLARRLSCMVDEAAVEGPVKLDAALDGKLQAMKGSPLQFDSFLELLAALSEVRPTAAGGMLVSVDREGDGTGVRLKVCFPEEAHATEANLGRASSGQSKAVKADPIGWHWNESVRVGAEMRLSLSGSGASPRWSVENGDDLRAALKAACEAEPFQSIEVRVRLVPKFDR